jgi:hypothetical protein
MLDFCNDIYYVNENNILKNIKISMKFNILSYLITGHY